MLSLPLEALSSPKMPIFTPNLLSVYLPIFT